MSRFSLRENWRILLLVVMVLLSVVSVFAPMGNGDITGTNGSATAATEGPTNLQFGLELSGGTRLRAPLIGLTAEDVRFNTSNASNLQNTLANDLSLTTQDVEVRPTSEKGGTVEVFDKNVSKQELATALQKEGKDVQASDIRTGVTQKTLETAERVLDKKIKGAGLSGGDAAITRSATGGEAFIVVEVPNKQPQQVIDLVNERGTVLVVAHFPVEKNGTKTYRNVPMFTQSDFTSHPATRAPSGTPVVPITLTNEEAARNFSQSMQKFGFTKQNGVESCQYHINRSDSGYCIYTVSNGKIVNGTITSGEVVSAAAMGNGLAETIESGKFVDNPEFQIEAANMSEAQNLRLNMQAGALPTNIDIDNGTSSFIQPSQASEFKQFSLVVGLVAMLAVGGMVAYRYREPRVVLPMVMTAAAEVFILLGFAAAVGLAIDLSHIAGFIAVIGTGVDDLVIIADEILQQGDVSTNRVFRSRFRKAFWVIGAAAATTIVAMLPLAALSLGDLQGFALVTIVGVLIGVLVTRPAYGDVIRNLVME